MLLGGGGERTAEAAAPTSAANAAAVVAAHTSHRTMTCPDLTDDDIRSSRSHRRRRHCANTAVFVATPSTRGIGRDVLAPRSTVSPVLTCLRGRSDLRAARHRVNSGSTLRRCRSRRWPSCVMHRLWCDVHRLTRSHLAFSSGRRQLRSRRASFPTAGRSSSFRLWCAG